MIAILLAKKDLPSVSTHIQVGVPVQGLEHSIPDQSKWLAEAEAQRWKENQEEM